MMNKQPEKPSSKELAIIHQWIRSNYGKSNKCEDKDCIGKSKLYEYSLIYGKEYKKNITHFRMLCRSCHRKYDYKNSPETPQVEILRQSGIKYGAENGKIMCKFTMNEASKIRAMRKSGMTTMQISRLYKVHQTTIRLIVANKTYKEN